MEQVHWNLQQAEAVEKPRHAPSLPREPTGHKELAYAWGERRDHSESVIWANKMAQ